VVAADGLLALAGELGVIQIEPSLREGAQVSLDGCLVLRRRGDDAGGRDGAVRADLVPVVQGTPGASVTRARRRPAERQGGKDPSASRGSRLRSVRAEPGGPEAVPSANSFTQRPRCGSFPSLPIQSRRYRAGQGRWSRLVVTGDLKGTGRALSPLSRAASGRPRWRARSGGSGSWRPAPTTAGRACPAGRCPRHRSPPRSGRPR
jgi:hypothetical protein